MSFSSILASSDERPLSPTVRHKSSISSNAAVSQNGGSPQGPSFTASLDRKPSTHSRQTSRNAVNYLPTPDIPPKFQQQALAKTPLQSPSSEMPKMNGDIKPLRPLSPFRDNKAKIAIADRDVQAALAKIESLEQSDVEGPDFEGEREKYLDNTRKRKREVEGREHTKRKVCIHLI